MSPIVVFMPGGRRCGGGRKERSERDGGDAALQLVWIRHDGGTQGPRRKDRQQQPRGRLGIQVGPDLAVGLATPDQVAGVLATVRTARLVGSLSSGSAVKW